MGTTALAELLDALYPLRCFLCGARATDRWGWGCERHALPESPPGPRCGRCAARLPDALPDGTRCPACRRDPPAFARALALFDWRAQPEVHPWIFALKYESRPDLARPLGALLAERFLRARRGGDERGRAAPLFTHLPLHPRRRFERGYDQAELLARHAAEAAGAHFQSVLRRTRATPVQGGPGSVSRSANVRGAFVPRRGPWRARRATALVGREVWLVDDVMTSGASAGEAAAVLRKLGVAAVGVLVLARAGGAGSGPERGDPEDSRARAEALPSPPSG